MHSSTKYVLARFILWVALCAIVFGCAALQKVSDAHKTACELLGENNQAEIQAEAKRLGIDPLQVWKLWQKSCEARHLLAADQSVGTVRAGAGECDEEPTIFEVCGE